MPAEGGLAGAASIGHPVSVASDRAGGFYFASYDQARIYRVTAQGKFSFVAGNGTYGFSGDGGPATSAQINMARGLATDSAGTLFFSDGANARIRKVTPDGLIRTVAGTGLAGFSGDGGPATLAQIDAPESIVLDTAGNLFFADMYNARIRKVTPGGTISTVAGNGAQGFGGDGGPATSAKLCFPYGVTVDAIGNLYIADTANSRIRKVTKDGLISSVAGNGTVGYEGDGGPAILAKIGGIQGITVDAAGNLFIADSSGGSIRKITPDGVINTVAGNGTPGFGGDGGPATAAQISYPMAVALDTQGFLFIADYFNQRIRKVAPGSVLFGSVISTAAGNGTEGFSGDGGPANSAQIRNPLGVTVDKAGNLYFVDNGNNRIRKVTPSGIISTIAGDGTQGFAGDGGPATSAKFDGIFGIAVDAAGNLFVTDAYNARIRKISPDGNISTIAGDGFPGNSGDGGPAIFARFQWPYGITVDAMGNLFIADTGNQRVRKITPLGVISTVAGNGTKGFGGDGGLATSAQFQYPYGLAVDTAGNLFISDMYNHRVRKVTPGGIISTVAGDGSQGYLGDGGPATLAQLSYPHGLAVDAVGNLYIVDQMDQRIRKVTPEGIISVVAGYGTQGFSGDGGQAVMAELRIPYGVAVDTAGNLFISDMENDRIRKVSAIAACSALNLTAGGVGMCQTSESRTVAKAGYARFSVNTGATPYATAVFRFRQNGVTVSEAGVPASPPTTQARVFIEYRSETAPTPGQSGSGAVDINTGIAAVNTGSATANIALALRALDGSILATGHGTLPAGRHFSKFVDQLKDIASDFIFPAGFSSDLHFGSLEISSDQPLSLLAVRGAVNQRNEFLTTTTPVADMTQLLSNSAVYFPQVADGGGYSSSLLLMNTSAGTESGILQILDNDGNPMAVTQAGGASDSSFRYAIPAGGAFRFQTSGAPAVTNTGSIRLIPDSNNPVPIASGVFSYKAGGVLVSESGIAAALPTTHARVYVDLSNNHNTGLAIANVDSVAASIEVTAYSTDGTTAIGTIQGPLKLSAGGHEAKFADQLISGLPPNFAGVLDIRSSCPFAVLTVRALVNERNEPLMTTFPVADVNRAAPSTMLFPQIADGGGYVTEFILVSAGQASGTTLRFYDEDGSAAAY